MFIIPSTKSLDFKKRIKTHLLLISTADVYYQNSRMLRGPVDNNNNVLGLKETMKILTHDDYKNYLDSILGDIELETECMDAFVPAFRDSDIQIPEDEDRGMFTVNRVGPEYEEIKKRMTVDTLKEIFPATHPVCMTLIDNPAKYDIIIDDIYVSWCMHTYIRVLDTIRLQILDNMTPAIEYTVDNIDYFTIKRYLHTDKINDKKAYSVLKEMFFGPDYKFTCAFYDQQDGDYHFDLDKIMKKLMSNIDVEQDRAIVISIYLTCSFAMADIRSKNVEAPCVKYVKDVLAKIK